MELKRRKPYTGRPAAAEIKEINGNGNGFRPSNGDETNAKGRKTERKNPTGPESLCTKEMVDALALELEKGVSQSSAERAVGLSLGTVSLWRRNAEEGRPGFEYFAKKYEEAMGKKEINLVSVVFNAAKGGDVRTETTKERILDQKTGQMKTVKHVIKRREAAPDWHAAVRMLESLYPDVWLKTNVFQIQDPGDVAKKIREHMGAIEGSIPLSPQEG
jgi:hypothetical protein